MHDDLERCAARLHLELDGGDLAVHERDQPSAAQQDLSPGRGAPAQCPAQDPGTQIEHAIVGLDDPRADVERFPFDDHPDARAVGDVDEHLIDVGIAGALLGVRNRACLEEAVEVGAGDGGGCALVQRPAYSEEPVAQREQRLALGS